jgi:hypothetical protein
MEGHTMNIQLKADTKKLTKHLSYIQKQQVPFATSVALNQVAFDSRLAVQSALPKKLDRPTKGLVKSVIVEKSKKKHLIARVGFVGKGFGKSLWSESPAVIMARLISGGTRKPKGKAIAVPIVKNIKLNKFGNLPRKKISKLLANPKRYFSGKPTGRDGGVFERIKKKGKPGKLKMLASYESSTTYDAGRFNLSKIVSKTVARKYTGRFNASLSKALASAK